ncbi:MAG: rRNA pseudouridine synthase [Candidatus Nanopelagicaceae bacterium]|nr:rRNA pseudouridine synthase [Candidatus Nanopelagicaceae bacterium]
MAEIRLQKYLADAGVASRRKCEELIEAGRVKVNGKTISALGTKIDPLNTKVEVDNKSIQINLTKTYIAFYKPKGILSTMSDDRGRSCIGDYFQDRSDRLFHVGRLDKESEGLILLTNDGDWAQQISHPSHGAIKTYQVFVEEAVTRPMLANLKKGVRLEDGLAIAERANLIPGGFEVEIHEGRNQIVRRMAASQGLTVDRLKRVQIGKIRLGELKSGKWRYLSKVETTKP